MIDSDERRTRKGSMNLTGMDLAMGLICYVVFLFSVVLHEAAHAWTAFRLGDATAYRGGQVTLDPVPHIRREPLGMVVVPILLFLAIGFPLGWASAPFNVFWAQQHPRRAAVMALAGPLSNLLVVVICALLIRVGVLFEAFHAPESLCFTRVAEASSGGVSRSLAVFLSVAFSLNLLLFVFNLLPLPPLDGCTAGALFLDDVTARRYLAFIWQPAFAVVGLVLACLFFRHVFDPIQTLALKVLYPEMAHAFRFAAG